MQCHKVAQKACDKIFNLLKERYVMNDTPEQAYEKFMKEEEKIYDFEIIRLRLLNHDFDHVEMNNALSALDRVQNLLVAKENELLQIRNQLRANYE